MAVELSRVTGEQSADRSYRFAMSDDKLTAAQRADIDGLAASLRAAGGTGDIHIDGYASTDGPETYNQDLSQRRARAVANELEHPASGEPGVPHGALVIAGHGETTAFGKTAPDANRTVTVSATKSTSPAPPPATSPTCSPPTMIGSEGSWGPATKTGDDFKHFDRPTPSVEAEAKLALWALSYGGLPPDRRKVTDTQCEKEMDTVLGLTGGADGHAAFARFVAGAGGMVTHNDSSSLGSMALRSLAFNTTVAKTRKIIEASLAKQAVLGVLEPCALLVSPPRTHFTFDDPLPLKAVIGGTHGTELFVNSFTGSVLSRTYAIDLRFKLYDNFGVDDHDLYSPGLMPFWVLQHERSATKYAPFVNLLDLTVTISGSF